MSRVMKLCVGVAVALMLGLGTNAQAVEITGAIDISGRLVNTTNLGTTTSLNYIVGSSRVGLDPTGDFAVVPFNTAATMNNFTFNPFVGPHTVWSVVPGGFSFTLQSVSVVTQTPTFLNLEGAGLMNGTGFDATPYLWSFTATRSGSGVGTLISFTENDVATVPEPTSMLLLGSGLLGLGLWGRKRMQA